MLLNPEEAAALPLLDLWKTYSALPMSTGPYGDKVKVIIWVMKKLLARAKGLYLPPMEFLLKEMGINRATVREINVDIYELYEQRFRSQEGGVMKYRLAKAFGIAVDHVSHLSISGLRHQKQWALPRKMACAAHLTHEEAEPVCWSAILYVRIGRMAKDRVRDLADDAMSDTNWLCEAMP